MYVDIVCDDSVYETFTYIYTILYFITGVL